MGRSFVVIEGRGEEQAMLNLLTRLSSDLGRPDVVWAIGGRGNVLNRQGALLNVCERLRARGDCERLLIVQDDEDGCPREDGPTMAAWVRAIALPFPAAVVLLYREYETLFLPCLPTMAGKALRGARDIELPPLQADARYEDNPEKPRDAKGVLRRFFPRTAPYQPTTHQLALTRLIDFDVLRASGLPCFGTLERALHFLHAAAAGAVYPPAP